jgi:hypothetical protein
MCPGDVRKFMVPPRLAYGQNGLGRLGRFEYVPPDAAINYWVELKHLSETEPPHETRTHPEYTVKAWAIAHQFEQAEQDAQADIGNPMMAALHDYLQGH